MRPRRCPPPAIWLPPRCATALAAPGILASTVLRNMHVVAGGMTFGSYDTIFGISGLFFIAGGIAAIRPLRTLARHEAVLQS